MKSPPLFENLVGGSTPPPPPPRPPAEMGGCPLHCPKTPIKCCRTSEAMRNYPKYIMSFYKSYSSRPPNLKLYNFKTFISRISNTRKTLGHCLGDSFTHLTLITMFLTKCLPKGHQTIYRRRRPEGFDTVTSDFTFTI